MCSRFCDRRSSWLVSIISAHLLLSKIMCVLVKALWVQWKFRIDVLRARVQHGWEMSKNVTTHNFGKKDSIVTI